MITLDISCINNKYSKTLLYYLISINNGYSVEIDKIENFLKSDIGDFEYIMEQLDNDISKLTRVVCLKDGQITFKIKSKGYYNNAMLIMLFDEMDALMQQLDYDISTKSISSNIKLWRGIQNICSHINHGVGSFAMNEAHHNENFDFSKQYYPFTQLNSIINDIIGYWLIFSHNYVDITGSGIKEVLCTKFNADISLIKSQINFLEFMISIICVVESPFYACKYKKVLKKFYLQIQELMHNCFIGDFFIEYGSIDSTIHIEHRGSSDKTTRVQISFVLDNKQGYCLRLDFPHKGVNYIHININDMQGQNALPIENSQFCEISKIFTEYDEVNKLFYKYNNKYYFCCNFENELKKVEISEDIKNILQKIFSKQSHFKICDNTIDDHDLYACFDELNIYLNRCIHSNKKALKGQIMDQVQLIKRAIYKLDFSFMCSIVSLPRYGSTESIETSINDEKLKFVDYLYDFYKYDEFEKEQLLDLELIEILQLIEF